MIQLFPNPAGDFIQISGYDQEPIKVVIYNQTGEQIFIYPCRSGDYLIPVGTLKPGFYMARIIADGQGVENVALPFLKF